MRLRLEGKIAVITGSSSGIGLATAKRFAAEGAFVFMNGRTRETLSAAVEAVGGNARGIQGDVASLPDLDRLFEVVKTEKGRIDILYANAGAGGGSPLAEVSEKHFDAIVGTNMRGTLFTVQKALPLLTDGASIILQGSIAGSRGRPGRSVYNASKAALRSFARTWALELKGRNIRVNLLVPGPTATNALAGAPPEVKAFLASQVLRGTIAEPDEVANAALFLASDESSFVNATEFFVDGGVAQT
jgi:NAD(P)-dependent dehydrogenase (short-subunit alcohol dehydrogenase family)